MYGKLMSISDELMWKYWVLLTDLKQVEIDAMQGGSGGRASCIRWRPRRILARTITAGFHGEAAAASADENWARMFQQKGDSRGPGRGCGRLCRCCRAGGREADRLPKLLVALGLAASGAEANRKIAEKAVKVDGESGRGH